MISLASTINPTSEESGNTKPSPMRSHFTCVLAAWLFAVQVIVAQQTADHGANEKTKQILAYIADLPNQGKVLSGQFGGYSPHTFSTIWVDRIAADTSQVPAILGCDWSTGWIESPSPEYIIDYSCNGALKEHWKKGGLVTINMHLPNPASPNGGRFNDRYSINFGDLTNQYTETGQRWHRFLDRIAEGLTDLQQAGVTVLFRPFHEMNGDWFYWCSQDTEVFKSVWRYMFDYMTHTKQLHNLIWVYSPDHGRTGPARYYPGDSYVDIVALDVYTDDPNSMYGYEEMMQLNKPFALGEVGPRTDNGYFDYMQWIYAIESRFPRIAYFFAWDDGWSPISNLNAYSFYNHPRLVNLGQLHLGHGYFPGVHWTYLSNILYSFSQKVGRWTGENLAGGPWRSEDLKTRDMDSLKADVRVSEWQSYYMYTRDPSTLGHRLDGRKRMSAEVRVAPWGFPYGGSMLAKLYLKAGAGWQWYDSGTVNVNGGETKELVVDLSAIPNDQLRDVKEVGVQFQATANGDQTSIYLSSIAIDY